MIRFVNCIRKHEKMTDEIFRQYWNSELFSDLVFQVARYSGADRYAKSLSLKIEANNRLLNDRGGLKPFDGTIELWWESPPDLLSLYDSEEGQALINEILNYEQQFVDFTRSSTFFTETNIQMVKVSRNI